MLPLSALGCFPIGAAIGRPDAAGLGLAIADLGLANINESVTMHALDIKLEPPDAGATNSELPMHAEKEKSAQ
jgi:hypothetical protein